MLSRAPDAAQHEVMRCTAGAHECGTEEWRSAEEALHRVRDTKQAQSYFFASPRLLITLRSDSVTSTTNFL
ncbi:hypothetical protein S23_68600 [Bradyrhizobium cosmicum]|uniref:Uncharacterized protein n=1 Tax=Bradyrhizobium cosmicum TaxID=1404864 RepID=A0AAI8QFX7_9BRAD|nr:hypothetical protein S23_68600 [Bradyrhizobium cosmicum]